MVENKNNMKLDTVREEIREPLKAFAEKLTATLGDNLQSITVVGSSLTGDFVPKRSDINTVLVLGEQNFDE
jgi:predicted nucleotidyltransferase